MLLFQTLSAAAKRLPDKPALICDDWTVTYGEFERFALSLAARLQKIGLKKGDRVALLTPNCNEFAIAYFACHSSGFVCVPLNNRLSAKELTYILNDSGASVLIVEDQFWKTSQQIMPELNSVKHVIYAGPEPKQGTEHFRTILEEGGAPTPVELNFDDLACVMYTSGTTGLPKGAMMTHRNIMANARNCGAHLNYIEKDVTLIAVRDHLELWRRADFEAFEGEMWGAYPQKRTQAMDEIKQLAAAARADADPAGTAAR